MRDYTFTMTLVAVGILLGVGLGLNASAQEPIPVPVPHVFIPDDCPACDSCCAPCQTAVPQPDLDLAKQVLQAIDTDAAAAEDDG